MGGQLIGHVMDVKTEEIIGIYVEVANSELGETIM